MSDKKPKYLRHVETGRIYGYSDNLARRKDKIVPATQEEYEKYKKSKGKKSQQAPESGKTKAGAVKINGKPLELANKKEMAEFADKELNMMLDPDVLKADDMRQMIRDKM